MPNEKESPGFSHGENVNLLINQYSFNREDEPILGQIAAHLERLYHEQLCYWLKCRYCSLRFRRRGLTMFGWNRWIREMRYQGFPPGTVIHSFYIETCKNGENKFVEWEYGLVVEQPPQDGPFDTPKLIFLFGSNEDYARLLGDEDAETYRYWFEDKRFRYIELSWTESYKCSPNSPAAKYLNSVYPIILAKWELEVEIRRIKLKQRQIEQLLPRLSSSTLYCHKESLLHRLDTELGKALNQSRQLGKEYDQLINEAAIGLQLAVLDPDSLDTLPNSLELNLKLGQIRESISQLQAEAEAYAMLVNG